MTSKSRKGKVLAILSFLKEKMKYICITMKEIWKDIEGFEGLYQVSNYARVKSLNYGRTGNERVLKPRKEKNGYLRVWLCKDGVQKHFFVHRLVAEAFIPNPDSKPCIDHLNTDRTDNRVENLRWCTCQENSNNPLSKQKQSEAKKGENHPLYSKYGAENPKSKPIVGVNKLTGEEVRFACAMEAQMILGICKSSITACCRGKLKSAGGYVWGYA